MEPVAVCGCRRNASGDTMFDIEEELRSPILYTEIREDYASWFIIIKDQTAYKFVLKQSDLITFQQ